MTKKKWTVPPELAAYDQYTNYPGRGEELINSPASFKNNVIVAAMACEAGSQWDLLARLRQAGLLLHPDDAHMLCGDCRRPYERACPDCGACEANCFNTGTEPCGHPNAKWGSDGSA